MSAVAGRPGGRSLPRSRTARLFCGLQALIVEDDEADAYLMERILSEHARIGDIVRAVDGAAAMALIEGGLRPDFAIIDLHMPRKNGFSLLLELSCLGCSFPMIVLTSSSASSDAIKSRLRGARKVLTKPGTIGELRKQFDAVIAEIG